MFLLTKRTPAASRQSQHSFVFCFVQTVLSSLGKCPCEMWAAFPEESSCDSHCHITSLRNHLALVEFIQCFTSTTFFPAVVGSFISMHAPVIIFFFFRKKRRKRRKKKKKKKEKNEEKKEKGKGAEKQKKKNGICEASLVNRTILSAPRLHSTYIITPTQHRKTT